MCRKSTKKQLNLIPQFSCAWKTTWHWPEPSALGSNLLIGKSCIKVAKKTSSLRWRIISHLLKCQVQPVFSEPRKVSTIHAKDRDLLASSATRTANIVKARLERNLWRIPLASFSACHKLHLDGPHLLQAFSMHGSRRLMSKLLRLHSIDKSLMQSQNLVFKKLKTCLINLAYVVALQGYPHKQQNLTEGSHRKGIVG